MSDVSKPPFFATLFYEPGETIQRLISAKRGHRFACVMAAIFGAVQAAPLALTREGRLSLFLLIGAVSGIVGLYLFSWLLRNFGRWFSGTGTLFEVRSALGVSLLPWVLLFAATLVCLALEVSTVMIAGYYWLFFGGLVYGYVIVLISLSKALSLSLWKTLFVVIITVVFSIFPITLFVQLAAPDLLSSAR